MCGPAQDGAFKEIKAELARPTMLALYNLDDPIKICADASAYGAVQLLLDEESSQLVTVNTHLGLYRYSRLPFGVSSAPPSFRGRWISC